MVIRVLLAEDNDRLRLAERGLLEVEPEIEVVGETAAASHAIQLTKRLRPHVVVMDLNMYGDHGVATREIKFENPTVGVLAIATLGERTIKSFIRALGADELLGESELGTKLIPTIKLIALSER